ncbi:SGNH/GDSL hydrolase family protein [Coraliomargarita parva]|uniref:SGNH/GDSL hydrolase family protein n=1 Tax=Coraliomargarita parva TaxID=3014050 RepID=UPI0022B4C40C|nr:SGNH/GDSL hydrolase family protein [Coraliomargarita parva]
MNRIPQLLQLGFLSLIFVLPSVLLAQFRPGDVVAVIGDSITEQKKYSVFIEDYLVMCQPQPDLKVVQFGWGGEQANGMASRFQNDVLPFQPDVVTTCYGMNDGGYRPVTQDTLDRYRRHTTDYVQQMKEAGVRWIILGSPGIVDPASYKRANSDAEVYNHTLKELAKVGEAVAVSEGVSYADVYSPMMHGVELAKAQYGEGYKIANDGVHPGDNGHLLMAYAFLKALGCDGEIGVIEYDYASDAHHSDEAQTIVSAANGQIEVSSTRYPFCYDKDTESNREARDMAQVMGFDRALNRYMLVVKNAPDRAKVIWGDESHEYTSAELSAGINLAADFHKNPFHKPFFDVHQRIYRKQVFETYGIKQMINAILRMERYLPGSQEEFADVKAKVVRKDEALRKEISEAIVPITHTIVIEPAE